MVHVEGLSYLGLTDTNQINESVLSIGKSNKASDRYKTPTPAIYMAKSVFERPVGVNIRVLRALSLLVWPKISLQLLNFILLTIIYIFHRVLQ